MSKIVPPYLNKHTDKLQKEVDKAKEKVVKAKEKYDFAVEYLALCEEKLKNAQAD